MMGDESRARILLIGFPGHLAWRVCVALLRDARVAITALVGSSDLGRAEVAARELDRLIPAASGRFGWYRCDWEARDLGLGAAIDAIVAETTGVADLTGVGDPCLPADSGSLGTLLALAPRCPHLRRFDFLSTAFVSGERRGIVAEADFARGQGFENDWEEAAFAEERRVREARLPVPPTIYRPTFLIGDSRSGEIDRFTGAYTILRLFEQLNAANLPIPRIGRGAGAAPIIPVDYVAAALAHLLTMPAARGKTFHLADPDAPTVGAAYRRCAELLVGRRPAWSLTPTTAARALRSRSLRPWDISPGLVPYLNRRVTYETASAHALLAPVGIMPPSFRDYAPAIVDFFADHCDDPRFGAGLA